MNKIVRFRIARAALALFAASAIAQGGEKAQVHVTWAPTASLSEVKDNPGQHGWMDPAEWENRLNDYLVLRAGALLPRGQRLDVAIDDIKLAGAFEPWHGANAQDIRYMKEIYPPRVTLHYKLSDAQGATIREGTAKLSDMAYLQRPLPDGTDPLRYDKRLFDDWLRREFGDGKT